MEHTTKARAALVFTVLALALSLLLTSCVNFSGSSIDDVPPLNFSEAPDEESKESEPPTEDGYTARPTVDTVVNTSPEVVILSGTCEEGAVVTATSPVDSVSVNSLNGYYILEYNMGSRSSRTLSVTAKVEGKEESTAREVTVYRDAMEETRTDDYEVTLGVDGYLFFRKEIDSYCGRNLITVSRLNNFKTTTVNAKITALENRAGGSEVELIYVLIPDSTSVYADYLPEGLERESYQTLYDQVSGALAVSNATLIDMRDIFAEHIDDGYLLYNLTDSHITDYAGYLVYSSIMTHIAERFPECAPHTLDEFTVTEESADGGDLVTYARLDNSVLRENKVTLTPNFDMDMGDSAHRLKLTTTNLLSLQKYVSEGSCELINGAADEDKTSILSRLYFCTERPELPSCLIYRDDSSAVFLDLLAERFNNCMAGLSGDYTVNLTDAGRHANPDKSIVDYVIIIVSESNLEDIID